MTAGVLLWPFVFITTDLINEYFGKSGVKRISYITAGFIAYSFCMISIAIYVKPSAYWLLINSSDEAGNTLNIDYAFTTVLGQGLNIIAGSLISFLVGQLLDAYIFDYIKKKTGDKKLWLRATGSTVISQLIDSFLVLFIAFYLLPSKEHKWSLALLFSVGIINYLYKLIMAILLTPVIYVAHDSINKYLGKK